MTTKPNPFQAFEMRRMRRTDIKSAPYNPRRITEEAERRLRRNLKKVGLLMPLVWNERTGNLVGGHQRLKILDLLNRGTDYELDVAVVQLDAKTEREQNIFLNNLWAQGEYDEQMLTEVLRQFDDGPELDAMGFDGADLHVVLGDAAVEFFPVKEPDDVITDAEEITGLRDKRAEAKEIANRRDTNDFYVVVIFPNNATTAAFLKALGEEDNERYISGMELAERLGFHLEEAELPEHGAEG